MRYEDTFKKSSEKSPWRIDHWRYKWWSSNKKAYKCYNLRLHKIVESADIKIDDLKIHKVKVNNQKSTSDSESEEEEESSSIQDEEEGNEMPELEDMDLVEDEEYDQEEDVLRWNTKTPSRRVQNNHPDYRSVMKWTTIFSSAFHDHLINKTFQF